MATYAQIQAHVRELTGRVPKTCWIADIKARHGLTSRIAPNRRGLDRLYPCPSDMVEPIEAVLRRDGTLV